MLPLRTVAPLWKPLPVSVTVYCPTGTGFGDTAVMLGPGGATLT